MINVYTILAGETKTAEQLAGAGTCFDKVYCDTPLCSFSARCLDNTTGEKKDRSALGVYGASDAKCEIASTGLVQGPFDIIYVSTTSDPIRVHVTDAAKVRLEE